MRRFKHAAPSIAIGAALALSACGGGAAEENNTALNAAQSGFGNSADPSAVETMGNGGEPQSLGNDGNAAANGVEGNAAGNAAAGSSNRM
jgi:hypothetical protein